MSFPASVSVGGRCEVTVVDLYSCVGSVAYVGMSILFLAGEVSGTVVARFEDASVRFVAYVFD